MDQNAFVVVRELAPQALVGRAIVNVAIDEIGNDRHRPLNLKFLDRPAPKIFGHRGDGITLFDAKTCDGQIRTIVADQGDIRSMKRRDEGYNAIRQHLLRQVRADGVGDRIVNMQNIQVISSHHFSHLRCEDQIVGRVFEQRVCEDFDLVEKDALVHRKANRKRIADEVNVVAAPGKFLAEFSSDDAASPVSWIASDADLHSSMT